MAVRPIHVLALVLLLCMVAVQVHACVETSVAQRSQHQCQLCKSGGWAEPVADASLNAQVVSNRLQDELALRLACYQPIEATSSRAPPQS